MEAYIEKIEKKSDADASWIELRVRVKYDTFRSSMPRKEDFVSPYIITKDGVPNENFRTDYDEAFERYVKRYGEWETIELKRIQHNNAIDRLVTGIIDISQAPIAPTVIAARPKEINEYLLNAVKEMGHK